MCAIAGILTRRWDATPIIRLMCDAQRHRGPDDEGFFTDAPQGVYIGHRRLSIIDTSPHARQPLENEDGSIVAAVNGEIYNYIELRAELISRGHRFRSQGDAETVVHAYEQWGDDCLRRLRGMFGLCIVDRRAGRTLIARDPLGIKPLYYLTADETVVFASEIRAFLSLPEEIFHPKIHTDAIRQLLSFPFIIDRDVTMLAGIRKVPPGHSISITGPAVQVRRYWCISESSDIGRVSFTDARHILDEKMREAVSLHLRSDVPVGFLLSGGVDSSLLAAIARDGTGKQLHTFTVGYRHPADERGHARRVARYLGAVHTDYEISVREAGDRIEEIAWHTDCLSAVDGGVVAVYLAAEQLRRRGIKVVITGEGADEIFCGYPWFALSRIPFRWLSPSLRNKIYYYRISKQLPNRYNAGEASAFDKLIQGFGEKDIVRQITRFELESQLPNNFLMKLDKPAMAHSLEVRVPYLDTEVVEYAYRLPAHFKTGAVSNKTILRAVAGKYLPRSIAARHKRGFLFPVGYMLDENREKVREYVLDAGSVARELLPRNRVRELCDSSRLLPIIARRNEALLWKIFLIEAWRHQFEGFLAARPRLGRAGVCAGNACAPHR